MRLAIFSGLLLLALFFLRKAFKDRTWEEGFRWLAGIQNSEVQTEANFSVTVLIPAYNEEELIADTIKSVQSQSYPVDKILVVNDSSEDNTAEVARNLGVEVVTTEENTGTKAQAQQYGLQFVETEVVINVDADTVLEESAIEKMVSPLADDVVSTCGFVIPRKIKTIWERARLVEYLSGIAIFKEAQDLWSGVLVSNGCFSSFKVEQLREIGGFPDRSIAEDMDVTWKLLEKDKRVKLVPESVCYPMEPDTFELYSEQLERWYRGFLQNVRLHKLSLFRNKRAFLFAAWSLLSGITAPLVLIGFGYFFYRLGLIALLAMGIEFFVVTTVSLVQGNRLGKRREAVMSVPAYQAVKYVNSYIFLKSLWIEWVRNDKLDSWNKGH